MTLVELLWIGNIPHFPITKNKCVSVKFMLNFLVIFSSLSLRIEIMINEKKPLNPYHNWLFSKLVINLVQKSKIDY